MLIALAASSATAGAAPAPTSIAGCTGRLIGHRRCCYCAVSNLTGRRSSRRLRWHKLCQSRLRCPSKHTDSPVRGQKVCSDDACACLGRKGLAACGMQLLATTRTCFNPDSLTRFSHCPYQVDLLWHAQPITRTGRSHSMFGQMRACLPWNFQKRMICVHKSESAICGVKVNRRLVLTA